MATTKITSAVGGRGAWIFAQDASGYPSGDQSGAAPYDGVRLTGFQSLSLTLPDPQLIQHQGDDVTFAQDYLSPAELPSATLQTGKFNLDIDALLQGTLTNTIGDAQAGSMATDKDGTEIDVTLIVYRQALDTDPASAQFGKRRWQHYLFPKTRIVPKGGNIEQGAADPNSYNLIPSKSTTEPWGVVYSTGVHGATQVVMRRIIAENPLMLQRNTGNGTLDTFTTIFTPISVAKTQVWANGTPQTVSSVSTVNKTYTLSAPAANNTAVVAFYETSDSV
jgi:hypothetical protein